MASLYVWFALLLAAASPIDGVWHLSYDIEAGVIETTSTFKADGVKLILITGDQEKVIGTFKNGAIDFVIPDGLPDAGFTADLIVKATIEDGKIVGYYQFEDYAGPVVGIQKEGR